MSTKSATKQQKSSSKSRNTPIHIDTSMGMGSDGNTSNMSPNTSTRWSRQQEKEQLSSLNDRLASYIDRVRNLETENSRLQVQIREIEVVERQDKEDLSTRYEAKVAELRNLLDAMNRQKAKLEIERGKAVAGYEELKAKVDEFEKKLKQMDLDNGRQFNHIQDLTARLNAADNARQHLDKENGALKKELGEERNAVAVLRRQLEDEVVLRTDLEGRVQSYKEDLEFMRRTHANTMEEFHRKRQIEMTSYSTEIENRYQTKLQQQLQNMRDDFNARIADNRDEMDSHYKRIEEEQKQTIHKLEEKLRDLQNSNSILISDYQDLLDLKVQLDTELQAYQKLLEGEETRLHITTELTTPGQQHHVSFADMSPGSRRGTKRKRIDQEDYFYQQRSAKAYKTNSHAEGDIEIEEVDVEGKFVRLANKGAEDVPIGNWLVTNTGGDKEVIFKFHSRQVIKAGSTITIWSNTSGQKHEPPTNIVMKNQSWSTGDAIRVEFFNDTRDVLAWRESVLEYADYRPGAANGADPNERCSLM